MGCVGGKQSDKKQLPNAGSAPKVQPKVQSVPAAPAHLHESSLKQQKAGPQPEKIPEHHNPHSQYPQLTAAVVEDLNRDQVSSGIKKSSNIKSDAQKQEVKVNQSSINSTNHRAGVPVVDNHQGFAHTSPEEPHSNVVGGVQEMKSYVQSGIAKSQNDARSIIYNKQKSALEHIVEEDDEKVHDEGVNNFAIPIKNINLHVEVK